MGQPRFVHTLRLPDRVKGSVIIEKAAEVIAQNKEGGKKVEASTVGRYRNGDEFIVVQVPTNTTNTYMLNVATVYVRPVLDSDVIGFNPDNPYQYVHVVLALDMDFTGLGCRLAENAMREAKENVREFASALGVLLGLPPIEVVGPWCVLCMAPPAEETRFGSASCKDHGGPEYPEWRPQRVPEGKLVI